MDNNDAFSLGKMEMIGVMPDDLPLENIRPVLYEMRNRDVIEFLGLWEGLHNPDFNPLEFEGFRNQAGANAFTMSPKKWIEATDAIGIVSKSGRYGGSFAHSDISLNFRCSSSIT